MSNEKLEKPKKSKIITICEDSWNKLSQKFDKDGFAIPISRNH